METDLYQVALDATWELDIFGGTRRAVETAEAEVGASEEDRRDVLVTLLGEMGLNYIELRGLQKEHALTRANLDAQEQNRRCSSRSKKRRMRSSPTARRSSACTS